MKLQEKLDTFKKDFVARAPKAALETMHSATRALADSGLAEKAVKVGDRAPGFSLMDSAGQRVTLADLLNRGPVVIAFYRGKW